jgi:hypothetical protein
VSLSNILKVVGSNGSQLFGAGLVGAANTTTIAGELLDKLWVYRMRRNGNAAAATMWHDAGLAPAFHHLVDPTTVASKFTLIWENMVQAAVALGACRVFAGFVGVLTAGVANTVIGVGFYADGANNLWHCFVHDCPTGVAPVTVRRDTATAILMTSIHRLKIEFDGPSKTITWYIDNVQVDTWTPPAALDRMGLLADLQGPEVTVGATVPALGDVAVRTYAGSLPLIRYLVRTTV